MTVLSYRPKRTLRLAAAFAALLALAGCDTAPPVQVLPPISFAGETPIQLDVGHLIIQPAYHSPRRPPYYDYLMPVAPEAAAVTWAKERLQPVGRTGYARVTIRDAKVIETDLPTQKGVGTMFTDQLSQRFDGTLDVTVEILDARHMPLAHVEARATASRSLPQGLSIDQRNRELYDLTTSLIHNIDSQMNGLINSYMARWIAQN
jgi:hypothetical protein